MAAMVDGQTTASQPKPTVAATHVLLELFAGEPARVDGHPFAIVLKVDLASEAHWHLTAFPAQPSPREMKEVPGPRGHCSRQYMYTASRDW